MDIGPLLFNDVGIGWLDMGWSEHAEWQPEVGQDGRGVFWNIEKGLVTVQHVAHYDCLKHQISSNWRVEFYAAFSCNKLIYLDLFYQLLL